MSWPVSIRVGEIEPSIYAADFMRLGSQLEPLLDAGARIFHFNVGDGQFVDEIMMGPIGVESFAGAVHEPGGMLDCHLMVSQPARHFIYEEHDPACSTGTGHIPPGGIQPGACAGARVRLEQPPDGALASHRA